jgi:DNA-binding response OmpR family regulator
MIHKKHIFLVEDDTNLAYLLEAFLLSEGFAVTLCPDGAQALKAFREDTYDLCLLDVMLPQLDGFCLAEQIRKLAPEIPLIFLTARSLKADRLKGFSLGADDYVLKPFDEEELLCRIQAILRRSNGVEEEEVIDICFIGSSKFDYTRQTLQVGEKCRRITSRENEVLRLLYQNKNRILRREDALTAIYGKNDYFLGRSFDVFITKIRKYLKDEPRVRIDNVFGVGFMLVEEEG